MVNVGQLVKISIQLYQLFELRIYFAKKIKAKSFVLNYQQVVCVSITSFLGQMVQVLNDHFVIESV